MSHTKQDIWEFFCACVGLTFWLAVICLPLGLIVGFLVDVVLNLALSVDKKKLIWFVYKCIFFGTSGVLWTCFLVSTTLELRSRTKDAIEKKEKKDKQDLESFISFCKKN